MRYVTWKDRKSFAKDMKPIYKAPTVEIALQALDDLEEKWSGKYPHSIRSWRNNWQHLTAFLDYPPAIRKIIYTN